MNSPDETTFEALRAYGLSDGEVRTLLALIELGQSEPKDIASKADVKQPKVYGHLNSLVEQEMVAKIEIEGKPNRYEAIVDSVINRIDKHLQDATSSFTTAIHHLEHLKSSQRVPPEFIRIFQGERAVEAGLSEIMGEAEDRVSLFISSEFEDKINGILEGIQQKKPNLKVTELQISSILKTLKDNVEDLSILPSMVKVMLEGGPLPTLIFIDPNAENLTAKSANFILPASGGMDPIIFHFRHPTVIRFQLLVFNLATSGVINQAFSN